MHTTCSYVCTYFIEKHNIFTGTGPKTGKMKVRQREIAGREDDGRIRDRGKRRREGEAKQRGI